MDTLDILLSEETPDLVRHCVGSYMDKNPGSDTNQAFAICVSTMQKSGYVEPGSMKLTAAGKGKEKEHETEPDAAKKKARYHAFLKQARESVEIDELTDEEMESLSLEEASSRVDALLAKSKQKLASTQQSHQKALGMLERELVASFKKAKSLPTDQQKNEYRRLARITQEFMKELGFVTKGPADATNQFFGSQRSGREARSPSTAPTSAQVVPSPAEESVITEIETILLEGQPRGPGRPPVPVGTVRRWEKEGHTVAMVKVGQPSTWIHKKQKESAAPPARGHSAKRGTVRQWKKRSMVKVAPGQWVSHKAKFSHEGVETTATTPELKEQARARFKTRLIEKSDLRAINTPTSTPAPREVTLQEMQESCNCVDRTQTVEWASVKHGCNCPLTNCTLRAEASTSSRRDRLKRKATLAQSVPDVG